MIPKPAKPASRRKRKPVEVELSVTFKFGDKPGEKVTVVDRQRIPMVNSVFDSRDRILRGFAGLLLKTGLKQPKLAGELIPIARLLARRKNKKNP